MTEHCPACGDPTDYCQGHGLMGDPQGWLTLRMHDRDDHTRCVPTVCVPRQPRPDAAVHYVTPGSHRTACGKYAATPKVPVRTTDDRSETTCGACQRTQRYQWITA